jgi:RNA polymerase sigma-70 factor (ECF subfamily)
MNSLGGHSAAEKGMRMDNFAELLEEQIPRLRRYARALCRNDVSAADDLVQDCLVRAVAKQHLYRPDTNLRAWLFTIMHNQRVNDVRRGSRAGTALNVDDIASQLVAVADPAASRQLRELDEAIAKLPHEQRQTILLIGIEGMSYEEVASILNIPIGTVRSRLSRGRVSLRRLMGMVEDELIPQPTRIAA